jgi:NAD-dependent dihydropyrimidine dehydrogenase PreA subunit
MFVVTVDKEQCEACGDCVDACPNELIAMVEEDGKQYAMYTGDPEECIECYSCEAACPDGALTITEV